jgi:hypothetical protein
MVVSWQASWSICFLVEIVPTHDNLVRMVTYSFPRCGSSIMNYS